MSKQAGWLAALVALIALTACQAGGGAAEDIALGLAYDDAYSGAHIDFPDTWIAQGVEDGVFIMSADPPTFVSSSTISLNTISAPLIVVRAAPLAALGPTAPKTADELIENLKEAASSEEPMTFRRTQNVRFVDFRGRVVEFEASDPESGRAVSGRLYAVITDEQAATFIGAAPVADWPQFRATLDAIIASVTFETPQSQ